MPEDQQINDITEEEDDNGQEEASTSKQALLTSLSLAQTQNGTDTNIDNLEYNSADEIRQTMKEVLSSRVVQTTETTSELSLMSSEDFSDGLVQSSVNLENNHRTVQSYGTFRKMNSVENVRTNANKSNRKRRGNPPTSNSKKVKECNSVTYFYDGKLSNVVPFGRYYATDSESDY